MDTYTDYNFMPAIERAITYCGTLTQEIFRGAEYALSDRPDLPGVTQLTIRFRKSEGCERQQLRKQIDVYGGESVIDETVKIIFRIDDHLRQLEENQEMDWRPGETIPEDYFA